MQENRDMFKLKKQIISSIKRKIRPLLWNCGYGSTVKSKWQQERIFHFKTAGCHQEVYKIICGIVVTEFQGFTQDGLIMDCEGGGMVALTFQKIPIEDLIRIENLLKKKIDFYKSLRKKMLHYKNNP